MDTIEKAIAIHTAPADVWSVLTDPSRIRLWLSDCGIEVRADWQVGGAMIFEGDFHGVALKDKGTILAFEPERRFAYRYWSSLSQLPDTDEHYLRVHFDLCPSPEGTTLSLRQENLQTPEIYGHWNFYWTMALGRIKNLAETGKI